MLKWSTRLLTQYAYSIVFPTVFLREPLNSDCVRSILASDELLISSNKLSKACEISGLIEARVWERYYVQYLCLTSARMSA